jgi:hypothetical protein
MYKAWSELPFTAGYPDAGTDPLEFGFIDEHVRSGSQVISARSTFQHVWCCRVAGPGSAAMDRQQYESYDTFGNRYEAFVLNKM